MPVRIGSFANGDLDALYTIALTTGDAGKDVAHLYADPRLMGHIYTAPYAVLQPDWCFVAAACRRSPMSHKAISPCAGSE